jgi:hypothetical protein
LGSIISGDGGPTLGEFEPSNLIDGSDHPCVGWSADRERGEKPLAPKSFSPDPLSIRQRASGMTVVWRANFAGCGAHPRAAPSHAMASVVRPGGRANGDEHRVAWTSSAGGATPSRRFPSLARDGGGVLQDSARTGNLRDCKEVKVRRCRFPESSGELRGFKFGK